MENNDAALLQVLHVAHDSSRDGDGLSLVGCLARCRYKELRTTFTAESLVPLLQDNPKLVQDWLGYSEGKRTNGGWYVLESGVIGELASGVYLQYPSLPVAIANFIVRELDRPAGIAG